MSAAAVHSPSNATVPSLRLAAWGLGFLIPFNLYVLPNSGRDIRVTDLLGIILWLALPTWLAIDRRMEIKPLTRLALLLVLAVPWALNDWSSQGLLDAVLVWRWILAVPVGYLLHRLTMNSGYREAVIKGLLWGAIANVVVIVFEVAAGRDLAVALGLVSATTENSTYLGLDRFVGMHGHPNATAAVISLCLPLALGLSDEGKVRGRYLALAGFGVLAGTTLTLTRSAAGSALVTLILWAFAFNSRASTTLKRMTVLLAAAVLLLFFGPPGGSVRWSDAENLESNSQVRFDTIRASWDLALANPFGVGAEYGESLDQLTVFGVTHNAFLQLALLGGLLLAAYVTLRLVLLAITAFRSRRTEAWLALHILLLFLFEEHFYNPVFLVLTVWLVASPLKMPRKEESLNRSRTQQFHELDMGSPQGSEISGQVRNR